MGDEELASVRVRTGVGHGENARFVVPEIGRELVLEAIAGAARARALGATALDHEPADHPVECQVIVKAPFGKVREAQYRARGLIGEEPYRYVARRCFIVALMGGYDGFFSSPCFLPGQMRQEVTVRKARNERSMPFSSWLLPRIVTVFFERVCFGTGFFSPAAGDFLAQVGPSSLPVDLQRLVFCPFALSSSS
jgi:hypothetical protein